MAVKKARRGRPNQDKQKLSAEVITVCAQKYIFEEKKTLSIRGLARSLNVDPMAIYHYFDNKTALLEAVTVLMMKRISSSQKYPCWQDELMALSKRYVALHIDYPGLLETLLAMGNAAHAPAQVFKASFDSAVAALALGEKESQAFLHLLVDYLHGFVLAMHCAPNPNPLGPDDMDAPLRLIFRALEQDKKRW